MNIIIHQRLMNDAIAEKRRGGLHVALVVGLHRLHAPLPQGLRRRMKDEMKSPSNFERLVLGCIDSSDSDQILIFSGFSRSTRFAYFCTAQIAKFQQKTVQIFAGMKMKFHLFILAFLWNLRIFGGENLMKFCRNFTEMFRKWQTVSIFWEKVR